MYSGSRKQFVATVTRAIACHAIPAVITQYRVATEDVTAIIPIRVNRRAALRAPLVLIAEVGGTVDTTHFIAEAHVEPIATHSVVPSGHLSRYALKRRCACPSRLIHYAYCSPPMIAIRLAIVILLKFRALAGLEPARVPLGLDSQAVSPSIIRSVSASVTPFSVIAVTVGVAMFASGTNRTVFSPLVAVAAVLRFVSAFGHAVDECLHFILLG